MHEEIFNLYIVWDNENQQYRAVIEDCERGLESYVMDYVASELGCVLDATRVLIDLAIGKYVNDLRNDWENER